MNKAETTQTINEFLDYNSNDIVELKSNNSDLFNAFSGLLVAIDKKYGSGDLKVKDFIEKKVEMVDSEKSKKDIEDLKDNFMVDKLIKYLPAPIKALALANQKSNGNASDENLKVDSDATINFSFSSSLEGWDFWDSIRKGDWDVYYSNPKYIKQKDTPSKEPTKERTIEDYKKIFLKTEKVKDLPPQLYSLAITNQVEQGNKQDDDATLIWDKSEGNFSWAKTPQGEAFWSYVNEGSWDEPEVASVLKSVVKTKKSPTKSLVQADIIYDTAWTPNWKVEGYRPSPQRSASKGKNGEFGMGWDGNWYQIKANKVGTQQWKKTPFSFEQIVNNFNGAKKDDLYLFTDQLKYAMSQTSPSDSIYKELQGELAFANSLK